MNIKPEIKPSIRLSLIHISGNRKPVKTGTNKTAVKADTAKEKQISAQQSIPYHEMAKDGICRVQDKFYSKTIRFYDINYQLAQNEDCLLYTSRCV